MRVWLNGLEWEYGGDHFTVGSEVEWDIWPFPEEWPGVVEPLGEELLSTITHYAFPDDGRTPANQLERAVRTRGRVESIGAVYFKWVRTHRWGRDYRPVTGSAWLEPRDEPFPELTNDPLRKLAGFIVELSPVDQPAL